MHTFFINTSDAMSSAAYRSLLFEGLLTDRSLVIPQDSVPPDALSACAQTIARLIDQESDVTESTRLVVYIEPSCASCGGLNEDRARMLAEERLLCLRAESELVWTLCDAGKQPADIVFVLGERLSRETAAQEAAAFAPVLHRWYWRLTALPPAERAAEWLNKAKAPVSREALIEFLRGADNPDAVITPRCPCYAGVVEKLADALLDLRAGSLAADDLLPLADSALSQFERYILRSTITGRRALRVRYVSLPLEFRDPQERNRSECRLMLCVYAWASGDPVLLRGMALRAGQEDDQSLLTAPAAPAVNYARLTAALGRRLSLCQAQEVRYKPLPAPPELNPELRQPGPDGEPLIRSPYAKVPALDVKTQARQGMTVRQLKKAVDDTLDEIERKNDKNWQYIQEYLNSAASEYDRIKDDALRRVPFLLEESGRPAGEKDPQDDVKNHEARLARSRQEAECDILAELGRVTPAESVTSGLAAARRQCGYYFDCLRRSMALLICAVCFALLFVVPYAVLRPGLLSAPEGIFYLGGMLGASAASLALGNLIFTAQYKRRVIRTLRALCERFHDTQAQNQQCLKSYADFLYQRVPRCYALARYEKALTAYRRDSRLRQEKIAYHDSSLRRRRQEIATLLDNIDRGSGHAAPAQSLAIDPDRSRVENGDVYLLSSEEVRAILGFGEERKA